MRILVATDAWRPQVNGVVTALEHMSEAAAEFGASFSFLTPEGFSSFALPTYADIRVALASPSSVARRIEAAEPDHIHIATEGPLGWLARGWCLRRRRTFTTSYHTRFPEYIALRTGLPPSLTYAALRRFHAPAGAVMAPTASIAEDLSRRGFNRVRIWTRGVDHRRFGRPASNGLDLPRPIFLSVGRLAVEKNLEALLSLDLPGSVVIVGEGPARADLQRRFPHAHYLGEKRGDALAEIYASADVFVFPSRTDTFGNVIVEAMASGLPVAAFPVPGPLDIVGGSEAGALDEDLKAACLRALQIPRAAARARSLDFTWRESARQFLSGVEIARASTPRTDASLSRVA